MRKGLDLPERLPATICPTTVPGAHVRLSKACHLPGSLQTKPEVENRGKHFGGGGESSLPGPGLGSAPSALLAPRRRRVQGAAGPDLSSLRPKKCEREGQSKAGQGRARQGRAELGQPADGLWARGTDGSRARPRSPWRGAAPRWGWEESGNSQPLVLRVQLPVHGEREAEEAPGIPRFPDHVVLAGVQVEGSAQRSQKPRRQVEQAQLARDRHGRARWEGLEELLWPPCARARGRGRAAWRTAAATWPRSPLRAAPPPAGSRSLSGRSPTPAASSSSMSPLFSRDSQAFYRVTRTPPRPAPPEAPPSTRTFPAGPAPQRRARRSPPTFPPPARKRPGARKASQASSYLSLKCEPMCL